MSLNDDHQILKYQSLDAFMLWYQTHVILVKSALKDTLSGSLSVTLKDESWKSPRNTINVLDGAT